MKNLFQKVLDEGGRTRLIDNIAGHLSQCTDKEIIRRSVAVFANVDDDLGRRLANKLSVDLIRPVKFLVFFIYGNEKNGSFFTSGRSWFKFGAIKILNFNKKQKLKISFSTMNHS